MNITFTLKTNYQQQKPNFTAMKKNQFKGIDLLVVNKFKPPIEQFDEMADFTRWVKNLLDKTMHLPSYKHFDPDFNRERMLRLFNWKQYLTKENPIYAAWPALMLVIYNGIAKDVKAENTEMPPLLNAGALAKTCEEMEKFVNEQKNPQYNFLNHYVENLRETEQVGDTKISESFNGWVVIPSKKNDVENFASNVEKLKKLSHPNWCTASLNAEPYLSQGDFHIYMENGKPRVGMRFENDVIKEIQGPLNNGKIPVAHIEQIKEHISQKGLNATEVASKIEKAEAVKGIQEKYQKAINENNIEEIFRLSKIKYEKLPDGTYCIKEFKQPDKRISYADIGISEAYLLDHISEIEKNLTINEDSDVERFNTLKAIVGNLTVTGSKLKSLGTLEYIGGNCNIGVIETLANLQYVGKNLKITFAKSLGNLMEVGNNCDFRYLDLKTANNLNVVGGILDLRDSEMYRFPNLEEVGKNIRINNGQPLYIPKMIVVKSSGSKLFAVRRPEN